jgi:hypothetical protein
LNPETGAHGKEANMTVRMTKATLARAALSVALVLGGTRGAASAGVFADDGAARLGVRPRTAAGVVDALRSAVRPALVAAFAAAGAPYPPRRMTWIALKDERWLELWSDDVAPPVRVGVVRIRAASGAAGPKLARGDFQVPEGVYAFEGVNPASRFHLSLRIGYPNALDRRMAAREGRRDLGGDIYLHGDEVSAGCIAVGDRAVEPLFYLAAQLPRDAIRLVIAPWDLRVRDFPPTSRAWVRELYGELAQVLTKYRG